MVVNANVVVLAVVCVMGVRLLLALRSGSVVPEVDSEPVVSVSEEVGVDVEPMELLLGEGLEAVGVLRLRDPALGVKVFGVREVEGGGKSVLVYGFGALVWVSADERDVVCGDEALLDVECVN